MTCGVGYHATASGPPRGRDHGPRPAAVAVRLWGILPIAGRRV